MRIFFTIALFFTSLIVVAQTEEEVVVKTMKDFHQSLNDFIVVTAFLHDSVSYGHSNGWIQNKLDLRKDAGVKTKYHSFKEDSISVILLDNTAIVRFVADIDVGVNNIRGQYHLRVLEVWIKKNSEWKLVARQAIKG